MKKTFYLVLCTFILCMSLISCNETTQPQNDESETVEQTSSSESDALETEVNESETPETKEPETDAPETDIPETDVPETVALFSRPEDLDLNRDLEAYSFRSPNGTRILYRLYVPEDYDETQSYPLLVFLHSQWVKGQDNEEHLAEAEMLFQAKESPVYGSIVLIPQCPETGDWAGGSKIQTALMDLVDSINETYNTDKSRQYYAGIDMGADGIRKMMETTPKRISAAVFQGEPGVYFVEYNGEITISELPKAMAEIPLCLAYSERDYHASFSVRLRDTLTEMGAEDVLLKKCVERAVAGDIAFTDEKDISVLHWLYGQERATDMTRAEEPKPETPKVDVEYSYFTPGEWFEYGEFTASNGITLPYRYYLPENYDESKEYPVLLFLHTNGQQGTDNERHVHQATPLFANANSPAFDSIVVVPQCTSWWLGNTIDAVAELLRHINSEFSTDSSRQYAMGVSMGGDGTWDLVCRYPELISAAAPVCGVGYNLKVKSDGTMSLTGVDPEAFDVPVCHVFDTVDKYFSPPVQKLWNHVLLTYGCEESTYRETSVYGHSMPYVTAEDISVLEWMFAQRRETTGVIETD